MHVRWQGTKDGCFKTESKGLREIEEFYAALFYLALSFFIALISICCITYSLVSLSLSVEAKHQESRDLSSMFPAEARA